MDSAETMMADGCECLVNYTSALECFMIMHSIHRVLNGGETFPKPKGRMVHVASEPLLPKEIAFIKEMQGSFPPLHVFEEQLGKIVGVTDYEVLPSTTQSIVLSASESACLAAETIRRIHNLRRFRG